MKNGLLNGIVNVLMMEILGYGNAQVMEWCRELMEELI